MNRSQVFPAASPYDLAPVAVLAVCLAALAAALIAQFVFGLQPCILCLYQRGPYVVAALLAAFTLPPSTPPRRRQLLLALCVLAFLVNVGIAAFHVGVEQHWWAGTDACTDSDALPGSPAEMLARLQGPPPVRCDQVAWSLFGISMAGYNVVLSLALAGFSLWAARLPRRRA
jgi:disulfide bond formation protein DsbB